MIGLYHALWRWLLLSNYKGEDINGVLRIKKSYEKLSDENVELVKKLDYITKEELIETIKKIADKVGVEVSFTYDNKKNKF